MQCAILVGGLGSRLGELVRDRPKPMLPVAGRPFLEYLIENVARFGFNQFLLLAGYRGSVIKDHFERRSDMTRRLGIAIRVVIESEPMGTGGALRNAASHLRSQFLLLNGDSFFDFNLLDLMILQPDRRWIARMALRAVTDASRYGLVSLADGNRIVDMKERPDRPGPGLVNGGVYWLQKTILNEIPAGPASLERTVFPSVARHGLLQGKAYGGFFLDIGTSPDFESAGAFISHRLKRPALFFDRDGVLNDDSGYTHRPADFRWTVGAREAVKLVNDSGWLAFVVTNQAGVARGLYTESAVNSLHTWMNKNLRQTGAHIDDFRYCPHHPDGAVPEYAKACHCRKPEPGMLLDLMVTWPVDRPRSVLIGNSTSDIAAASAAGIESRYYASGSLLDMVRSELARRGAVQDGELTGA